MDECIKNKKYLEAYTLYSGQEETFTRMQEHLKKCPKCKERYNKLKKYDLKLKNMMHNVNVPDDLNENIALNFKCLEKKRRISIFSFNSLAACFIIAFLFFLNPFSPKIASSEIIADSLRSHSRNLPPQINNKMSRQEISEWYKRKLSFDIVVPAFTSDMEFMGARVCMLCENKIAYLFYKKSGKRISLYIFDNSRFNLSEQKKILSRGDKTVALWKTDKLGYSLVADLALNDVDVMIK